LTIVLPTVWTETALALVRGLVVGAGFAPWVGGWAYYTKV
jgi:hypothetical protein